MIPPAFEILLGDVRARLAELPEDTFHTCVTSPPYWKLRRYMPKGSKGARFEIGSEPSFDAWIETMVEVLDGVKRVLRPDGTLWLNLGDSYNTNEHGPGRRTDAVGPMKGLRRQHERTPTYKKGTGRGRVKGLKHKDLIGQPWAVAFALRDAGWFLRSAIVWAKPNPLPESCTDRPTKSYELLFLLTRGERYFFDQDAVREPATGNAHSRGSNRTPKSEIADADTTYSAHGHAFAGLTTTRNLRDVWTFPTEPAAKGSEHFATFPLELPTRCILAGTSERGCCALCGAPLRRVRTDAKGGSIGKSWHPHEDDERTGNVKASTKDYEPPKTIGWEPSCKCRIGREDGTDGPPDTIPCRVLDPFSGTATTGVAALKFGRSYCGVELNPKTATFSRERLARAAEEFSAPIFERSMPPPSPQLQLFSRGDR